MIEIRIPVSTQNVLKRIGRIEFRTAAHRWAVLIAAAMCNHAKQTCPVVTGRLRASLTWKGEMKQDTAYAIVGTNVFYAPFVEFGPHSKPSLGFMQRAAQATKPQAVQLFRQMVKDVMSKRK